MSNISILNDKSQCYGCEACYSICCFGAIEMNPDEEGFLYPDIDNTKCKNCALCSNVCPAINFFSPTTQEHNIESYAAYVNDAELLKQVSSGGIATTLMITGLENGFFVYGVAYDDNYCGAHYGKVGISSLSDYTGTKYIQSRKGDVYQNISDMLAINEKVLFIGLPCEVAALKRYVGIDKHKNLYTVELICHGVTSPAVAQEYVQYIEKKHKGSVTSLSVRNKRYGWTPPCIKVGFDNGKTFLKLFDSTAYGYAFRKMSRPSCYNCHYKGDNRMADITIGDYWGCTEIDKCWNSDGVSVITVHTQKGKALFSELTDISVYRLTYEQAVTNNSMVNTSRKQNGRAEYTRSFVKNGIFQARKKTESIKSVCVRIARNIYYCLNEFVN